MPFSKYFLTPCGHLPQGVFSLRQRTRCSTGARAEEAMAPTGLLPQKGSTLKKTGGASSKSSSEPHMLSPILQTERRASRKGGLQNSSATRGTSRASGAALSFPSFLSAGSHSSVISHGAYDEKTCRIASRALSVMPGCSRILCTKIFASCSNSRIRTPPSCLAAV